MLNNPGQADTDVKIVVSDDALRAAAHLINTWDDRSDCCYDLKALVREVLTSVLGDRVTFGSS